MGKTVRIGVGDAERAIRGVESINAQAARSSSETWIPEESTNTGTLTITSAGTYSPESEDVYGYDKVNVLMAGGGKARVEVEEDGKVVWRTIDPGPNCSDGATIRGIDPSDGNVYYVKVNGDGMLSKVKIPSKAALTELPSRLTYASGDRMSYRGATVSLYYEDGSPASEWDGGSISYGTAEWGNHVQETEDALDFGDGDALEVTSFVTPFWFDTWGTIGIEYGIPFSLTVTRG